MMRHSRILPTRFTHEWGKHVKTYKRAFPKDSTSTWHNQDSNKGPPNLIPKPSVYHNATEMPLLVLVLEPNFNGCQRKG